jgi:hypothetical protein
VGWEPEREPAVDEILKAPDEDRERGPRRPLVAGLTRGTAVGDECIVVQAAEFMIRKFSEAHGALAPRTSVGAVPSNLTDRSAR